MKKILFISLSVLGMGIASSTFAAEAETCPLESTNIYFVNGVWNTIDNAHDSHDSIKAAYLSELNYRYPGETFNFDLSYNNGRGMVQDIVEVISQKFNEVLDNSDDRPDPEQYFIAYSRGVDLLSDFDIPDAKISIINGAIEEYLSSRVTNAVDSRNHIQQYQSDLQEGKRVLLISHSQGNMFANQSVTALKREYGSSIGLIGVATPANIIPNGGKYYTAHDDRVIDALRPLFSVLPSNVDNDSALFTDNRDFANHAFIPSYFARGLTSRGLIDNAFFSYMDTLSYPSQELGVGAITVTLKWGSNPDVDLHIYEPNGGHVYYGSFVGASGFLDRDDVSSYGPEHYFVGCDTLEEGTYRVGVNYYRGYTPENARVQIKIVGKGTRTFEKYLPYERGSLGNGSSLFVANIKVSKDGYTGEYKYEIEN